MIVYICSFNNVQKIFPHTGYDFNRLDSFFIIRNHKYLQSTLKLHPRTILDSGAFTFMMDYVHGKQKKRVSLDSFTDHYIDFINHFDSQLFFEMDVDRICGYAKVLSLRRRIENRTGKTCIPVFHMNRGLDDWKAMCRDYKYISIGVGGKDFSYTDINAFRRFNDSALEYGSKVHALGITGATVLEKVPFYSVDSSSWTCGCRFRQYHKFENGRVKTIHEGLDGKRVHDWLGLHIHNLRQWIQFSKYAELYL